MCGRFTLTQPAAIAAKFGLDNFAPVEPEFYTPRFNVAPTQRIVVIPTCDMQREARTMRWGLIPHWAKDATIGARLINARSREHRHQAGLSRRVQAAALPDSCGWILRMAADAARQAALSGHARRRRAVRFRRTVGALAGCLRATTVESCCVITCEPNELAAKFHNRMPVIIAAEDYETWLTGTPRAGDVAAPAVSVRANARLSGQREGQPRR